MKTSAVVLILAGLLTIVPMVSAAQVEAEHEIEDYAEHAEAGHSHIDHWKAINFAILVVILGWVVHKYGRKFFNDQTAKIQQGIVDARQTRADAEARAAEMDQRMGRLEADIADLRAGALEELAAEEKRLGEQTGHLVARVQANARQEISSATKQARKEVRTYATELALELARQKVIDRMTPEVSAALIERLGADLDRLSRRVN